ncbi:hypothetical protein [Eleftheria terrae]|uniref:hypothetical protein n=1 Tax=Eleftheria terrae TaxID=1597781 RepID=UPI00263BC1F6|nr:hypothetical protein [Eleftheria terrae]WKB52990.1 hypothetical protein N7L95_00885 [Eleftheria terrae]
MSTDTEYCPTCGGSGEGRHEGQVCWRCRGCGEIAVERPSDDHDVDYEFYLSAREV